MTLWKPNTERPKNESIVVQKWDNDYICGTFVAGKVFVAPMDSFNLVDEWCYLDDLIAAAERQAQMLEAVKKWLEKIQTGKYSQGTAEIMAGQALSQIKELDNDKK